VSYRDELAALEAPKETVQVPCLAAVEDLLETNSRVAHPEAGNEANAAGQPDNGDLLSDSMHEDEACEAQHAPQSSEIVSGENVQRAVVPEPPEQTEPRQASDDVPESWMDLDDDETSEPVPMGAPRIEQDAPDSWLDMEAHAAPALSLPATHLELQAANGSRHSRARKDFLNLCKAASKWQRQFSREELLERINASRVASDFRTKHGDSFDEKAFVSAVLARCGSP